MAEKLSDFTVKLLNNVRGRDELEIVLNKTGKEKDEKFQLLARLELALKYQEMPVIILKYFSIQFKKKINRIFKKKFVAHANCQQKLVEIWYSGIRKLTKMNRAFGLLFLIIFALSWPFCSLCYICAPNSKVFLFFSFLFFF